MADIRKRGINARMLMLKCDGSVYNLEEALEKPSRPFFPALQQVFSEHHILQNWTHVQP
jgi:hypothetical protein